MTILQTNSEIEFLLNKINNHIEQRLSICENYQNTKDLIFITDNETFSNFTTKIDIPEALEGFACNIGKYKFVEKDIESCHIIILNIANMIKAQLSDDEKIAVTLHELGHILNEFYNSYNLFLNARIYGVETKKIIERTDFNLECEYYADSFAKKYDLKDSLVSAFDKFTNKIDSKQAKEFKKRKGKLNSTEIFDGHTRKLQ